MAFYGILWHFMAFYGILWYFMAFMVFYGILCYWHALLCVGMLFGMLFTCYWHALLCVGMLLACHALLGMEASGQHVCIVTIQHSTIFTF